MKDCLRIAAWEGREACFSFFVFGFFSQEGGDADGWTEVTVRYSSCTLRRWCLDMAINQALFRRPIYSLLLPAWQINNNPCQPGPFPRHDQKADWTRHSCLLVGNSKICCMRLNMVFILLIFLNIVLVNQAFVFNPRLMTNTDAQVPCSRCSPAFSVWSRDICEGRSRPTKNARFFFFCAAG